MPRVFLLLSDNVALEEAESAAAILRNSGDLAGIATLGSIPWNQPGIERLSIQIRNPFDYSRHRILRDAIAASGADVVHAFGNVAILWSMILRVPRIGIIPAPRLVCSLPDSSKHSALLLMALRRVDRVVAKSVAEAAKLTALGIASEKISLVPTSGSLPKSTIDCSVIRGRLDIPPDGRIILAMGTFRNAAEMKTLVWAFDIVRYAASKVYLVLLGDGPERRRIQEFTQAIAFDDNRNRFGGNAIDPQAAIACCEMAWVIGKSSLQFALDAMAAGKPIVGMRDPEVAEVVGEAGRVVEPRDRTAMAGAALDLLNDSASRARLGELGLIRAKQAFSREAQAEKLKALYDESTVKS